jgi:hypothetical protein
MPNAMEIIGAVGAAAPATINLLSFILSQFRKDPEGMEHRITAWEPQIRELLSDSQPLAQAVDEEFALALAQVTKFVASVSAPTPTGGTNQ